MLEITRDEFLDYAFIPQIANAKEIAWFKSSSKADRLAIIVKTKHKRYNYLIYQKDNNNYVLYPNNTNSSYPDYFRTYCILEEQLIRGVASSTGSDF